MKLGLFGGSFDPIHEGHLEPVRQARRLLALDRVVFLPTAVPPHKPGRQFAPAHARYAMVELALLGEEGLYASAFELTEGRPAYTVDTLEHFRKRHPGAELYLLLGGDSFVELDTWKRWPDIVQLARLAVLVRPPLSLEQVRDRLSPELVGLTASERVHFVPNDPVAASSTGLRELIARGEEPPPGVVPTLVLEYIRKYSLYR